MQVQIQCTRDRSDTIGLTRFDNSIVMAIDTQTGSGEIVLSRETAAVLRNQLTHFINGQDDRRRAATNLHAWRL